MFLDADDYVDPDELSRFVSKLASIPQQDVIITDWVYNNAIKKASTSEEQINVEVLDKNIKHFNANAYFGLDFFRGLNIDYGPRRIHILGDKLVNLYALSKAKNVSYIPYHPYIYRQYGTSKPSDLFKAQEEFNYGVRQILKTIELGNPITDASQKYQLFRQMSGYVFINKANPENTKTTKELVDEVKAMPKTESFEKVLNSATPWNNMFTYSLWGGYNPLVPIITYFIRRAKD